MAKDFEMGYLLDFYGEVLTPKQREMLRQYYNDDLSLAEIADHCHITRQGVRDVIVRAEAVLTELEDKTGIIKRFHKMQGQFTQIQEAVDVIAKRNDQNWQDDEVEVQCGRIRDLLAQLKQE